MVQRRTRRVALVVDASMEEAPEGRKASPTRRVSRAKAAPPVETPAATPAPKPTPRRDPSSSTRVDYDAVILRYKERANTPKKAIRAMCIECMGGLIAEVDRCTSTGCALHPFRKGENPFHKLSKHNRTDEQEE